jgi:hypothetical protein
MSYTRPAYDSADASWVGAAEYTRPAYDAADVSWYEEPAAEGVRRLVLGIQQATGLYVGSIAGTAAYRGTTLVWSAGAAPAARALLLESGDYFLLESGDKLLLEDLD